MSLPKWAEDIGGYAFTGLVALVCWLVMGVFDDVKKNQAQMAADMKAMSDRVYKLQQDFAVQAAVSDTQGQFLRFLNRKYKGEN